MTNRWDKSRKAVKDERVNTSGSPNLLAIAESYTSSPEVVDVNSGYDAMDRERCIALSKRDSVKYALLCDELGLEPEAQDLYETGLAEIISRVSLHPENIGMDKVSKATKKSRSRFNYNSFGDFIEGKSFSSDVYESTGFKRAALKAGGYTHLWTGKGEKVPIERARDGRVGAAFEKCYSTYQSKK